jgi:hypothetical protein
MVLLGLTISLLAPDMYSLFERVQAKNELTKIKVVAELSVERSFFSGSNLEIIFEEKTVIISQVPDKNLTKPKILKKITSEFFTFEDTKILITQGIWNGSKVVNLTSSPHEKLNQLILLD